VDGWVALPKLATQIPIDPPAHIRAGKRNRLRERDRECPEGVESSAQRGYRKEMKREERGRERGNAEK